MSDAASIMQDVAVASGALRLSLVESHFRGLTPPRPEAPTLGNRVAAVFMLFRLYHNEPAVLLIKRAENTGRHRGEWAFPGGVTEQSDSSLLDTAYRETEEELGLHRDLIDHWAALDPVVTGTGFKVWPQAGRLSESAEPIPAPREVAGFRFVPVGHLLQDEAHRTMSFLRDGEISTHAAYAYDGRIIWGATARMLSSAFKGLSI